MTRAVILVLDSFGIGATADAVRFGDAGANTRFRLTDGTLTVAPGATFDNVAVSTWGGTSFTIDGATFQSTDGSNRTLFFCDGNGTLSNSTFVGIGLATLASTMCIWLFVRDAPDGSGARERRASRSFRHDLAGLWRLAVNRELWPIYAIGTCFSVPFMAIGGLWSGPYLSDVHGLSREASGLAVAAMVLAYHLGNLVYGPAERHLRSCKRAITIGVSTKPGWIELTRTPFPRFAQSIAIDFVIARTAPFDAE